MRMNENEIKKSSALEPGVGFLKNNSMVLIFLVLAVFLGVSSGNSFSSLGADASSRFFRNILLIAALVLPIMSGIGLNFGITLGAMAAEFSLVVIMILQIDNQPLSIVYWVIVTVIVSAICGKLLAALFNRTKGHEMIAGLLVGFFANGIYDLLLMVGCGDILKINVNGLTLQKGLPIKATVGLSAGLTSVLDKAFPMAYYFVVIIGVIATIAYFLIRLVYVQVKSKDAGRKKLQLMKSVAGIVIAVAIYMIFMNVKPARKMIINVDFPVVTAAFSTVVLVFIWFLMKSKLGHDFTSIRNDRRIAASVGINVDKCRTKSIILSTIIAGLGQILYIQNLGTMNTYLMHNTVGTYAIAAILIGGATVKSANIKNVLIGNILFQIIYGCAPNAAKVLMGNSQLGEYFRVFLCYAIIAVAIINNAIQETAAAKRKADNI